MRRAETCAGSVLLHTACASDGDRGPVGACDAGDVAVKHVGLGEEGVPVLLPALAFHDRALQRVAVLSREQGELTGLPDLLERVDRVVGPRDRLVDEGLRGRPEGGLLCQQHQPVELSGGVEVVLGRDEVVDQADREPARGFAYGLVCVGEDDVVDPRLARDAAGLAP